MCICREAQCICCHSMTQVHGLEYQQAYKRRKRLLVSKNMSLLYDPPECVDYWSRSTVTPIVMWSVRLCLRHMTYTPHTRLA